MKNIDFHKQASVWGELMTRRKIIGGERHTKETYK